MNTTTSSINFSRMIAIASFSALASSIAAVCTAADSTDAPLAMVANGVRNVSVNYADLNVSSPQGADALYTRIQAAADQVCGPVDSHDLNSKMRTDICIHHAITDAVTNVNQAALLAVYNTKNSTSKPLILATDQTR